MPVTHSENIIEVEHISFRYDKTEALKDITFAIHRGDYLGIVGPNGAGKTTLLKIILGLLEPSQGAIRLFGVDSKTFKDRSKIGYVPQRPMHASHFPVTVKEVVAMGLYAKKGLLRRLKKADANAIAQALERVSMQKYAHTLIGELSGGQLQKVFIARALVSSPEILFLDEPTAGIDAKSHDEFYALLKELNQKFHITVVIVSHDIERITKEAMHIACVDCTLVCHASPEEFLKESASMELFGQQVKVITHHHDLPGSY